MGSIYAELHVGGLRYPLTSFSYEATQATDSRGRANAKVRHHFAAITLDVPEDDLLLHWGNDPHKRLAATIVTRDADGGQARETLSMAGAYCVNYDEYFVAGDAQGGSYQCALTLSDPDGWTLVIGGTGGPLVMAQPRDYVTPAPPPAVDPFAFPTLTDALRGDPFVQVDPASLPTKRERYAARMQLLGNAKAKVVSQVQAYEAGQPNRLGAILADATHVAPSGPVAAALRNAGLPLPPTLPPDVVPAALAIGRLELNNFAVEGGKLADDTYFNDALPQSDGLLHAVHFDTHTPDGTFLMSDSPEGWQVDEVFKDEDSGFMAVLYHSTYQDPPQYVLGFRGTDADPNFMDELKLDGETDALQATGQYTKAFDITEVLAHDILAKHPNVVFVGHSLGGAEASLAALATGRPAYTYNSAGLHVNSMARANVTPEMLAENESRIQAFYADNDPLSFYQDRAALTKLAVKTVVDAPLRLIPGLPPLPNPLDPTLSDPNTMPGAIGTRHLIPSGSLAFYKGADVGGHSVGPMLHVIEDQKTQDSAALLHYLGHP